MKKFSSKSIIPLVILAITIGLASPTLADSTSGDLVLKLSGFSNNTGKAKVALVNSSEQYQARKDGLGPYQGVSVKIVKGSASYRFRNIPFGDYAIKVFHDENNNDNLDLYFFGMPKERYGFSNNVRDQFGMPSFEQAKFSLADKVLVVVVELE